MRKFVGQRPHRRTIKIDRQAHEETGTATVCTHGLIDLGLPELVFDEVPLFLAHQAVPILLQLANDLVERSESGTRVERYDYAEVEGLVFQYCAAPPVECDCCGRRNAWRAKSLSWIEEVEGFDDFEF